MRRLWTTIALRFPRRFLVTISESMSNKNVINDRIVVVIGTTGVGKSDLAMELARHTGGDIVNCDSLQLYRGLDVCTNKATAVERAAIPHHLLDVLTPMQTSTVTSYRDLVLPIIEKIQNEKRIPVLVGGTNYYVQAVLWPSLMDEVLEDDDCIEDNVKDSDHEKQLIGYDKHRIPVDSVALHHRLQEVDPVMASRLHPHNARRIARSLEIFDTSGRTHSSLLQDQQSKFGNQLRYSKVCVIWLDADMEVLTTKLDKRVDNMVKSGMLEEIYYMRRELHAALAGSGLDIDYSRGIGQAIGFKEYEPYFRYLEERNASSINDKLITEAPEAVTLLTSCINRCKMSTRQYARRQITWIKNRFLPRQELPMYRIDATLACQNKDKWFETVVNPSLEILDDFLNDVESHSIYKIAHTVSGDSIRKGVLNDDKHTIYKCEPCAGRIIQGNPAWKIHLKSRSHRRNINFKDYHQLLNDNINDKTAYVCKHCSNRVIIGGHNWNNHCQSKSHRKNEKKRSHEQMQ